ncbi:TPA: conjugal transfer protein TraD [Enterococcus faecalis]|jgi:hypothetical protein
MENQNWLQDRVTHLKGLKARSDQQELLVLLAEKNDRTPQDEKKLALLVKAEKAAIRAAKARTDAAALINSEKKVAAGAKRRARNHRLILQGLLLDFAGLENRDRGEVLGLLLAAANTEDPQRWASWKAKGDAVLQAKAGELATIAKELPKD